MKKRLVGQCFITSATLLLLFIGVRSGECGAVTDTLVCNDVSVEVETICTEGARLPFPECTAQTLTFKRRWSQTSLSQINNENKTIRPEGERLHALVRRWACVVNKKQSYVFVEYATGGTCATCEWHEVYDARGKRVMELRVREEREIESMNARYMTLGLGKTWPRDAFLNINILDKHR